MKCNKCGYVIPDDSEFCQFCGTRIEVNSEIETVVAPIVEPVVEDVTPSISTKEITESQRYFDSDYGYSPENPIVTSSVHMVGYYLYSLRTVNGQRFTWERQPRTNDSMIDEYQLFVDGTPYKKIYFNPHGEDRSYVPAGLVRDNDAFTAAKQGITLEEYQAKQAAEAERINSYRKKKKRTIAISVIALILVASSVLFYLFGIPGIQYMQAKNLLNSGNYDAAYAIFYDLGSFANSAEMCSEARYRKAVKLREEKNYEDANRIFKDLGEYKDSKELIHSHKYDRSVEVAATCTTPGVARMTCSCGKTYTEEIAATGHKMKTVSSTASTCTKEGQKIMRCTRCGEETTETLKLIDHSYTSTTTKAATCTATGVKTYTCTGCGTSYTEDIAKIDHSYKNATCTAAKTCTMCGKTSGSALGHTNTATCTRCGTVLFSSKTYTGYGPGNVSGITLPEGTYNITITHNGSRYFAVWFNRGSVYDDLVCNQSGKVSYVYQVKVTGSSPVKNGYFNITSADGSWSITIQAVG